MNIKPIRTVECDMARCMNEAQFYIFLDLELADGLIVSTRLRLCSHCTEQVKQSYAEQGQLQDTRRRRCAQMARVGFHSPWQRRNACKE